MSDRTAILLQRIEQGYRNDAARLKSMGQDFQFTLESAKRVGDTPTTTEEWKQGLHREWSELDTVVQRMNASSRTTFRCSRPPSRRCAPSSAC